jgi:hypothetical protein
MRASSYSESIPDRMREGVVKAEMDEPRLGNSTDNESRLSSSDS